MPVVIEHQNIACSLFNGSGLFKIRNLHSDLTYGSPRIRILVGYFIVRYGSNLVGIIVLGSGNRDRLNMYRVGSRVILLYVELMLSGNFFL